MASEKPRRSKRSATDGTHILQIARLKVNATSYDFTYYLKNDGNYVQARILRDVLRRLTTQEMSSIIGLRVTLLAETYFGYESANSSTPQRLWVFFLILTNLVILVLVTSFVLCCYINCLRPQASPYWMLDSKGNALKHVRIHPLTIIEGQDEEVVRLAGGQSSAAAAVHNSDTEEVTQDDRSETSGTGSSATDSSESSSLEENDTSKASHHKDLEEKKSKVVPRFVDENSLRLWKKPNQDSDALDSYKRVRDPRFQEGITILARLLDQPPPQDFEPKEEKVRVIEVPMETVTQVTKPRLRTSPIIERDILKMLNTPHQVKPATFHVRSIDELPSTRILPLPFFGVTSRVAPSDFGKPAWQSKTTTEALISDFPVTKGTAGHTNMPPPSQDRYFTPSTHQMPLQTTSTSLACNSKISLGATGGSQFPPPSPYHEHLTPTSDQPQTRNHSESTPGSTTGTIFVVDTCRSTMTRRN